MSLLVGVLRHGVDLRRDVLMKHRILLTARETLPGILMLPMLMELMLRLEKVR